jgi:uncharacterized protein (UPF0276 family)
MELNMFYKPNDCLGVGVNYRGEIARDILENINEFDFIEMGSELLFYKYNENLHKIIDSKPITLHGLSMSIGSNELDVDSKYLSNLYSSVGLDGCKWFSDHLAVTSMNDYQLRTLMPIGFNQESLDRTIHKIKQVMSISEKPFLLENITYYYSMPTDTMSEIEFFSRVIRGSDCGILLDLNNLYVNSVNHHYDPIEFINLLPLDHIIEVHLAGCDYMMDTLIDTHASQIKKEVLDLFEYVCKLTFINGVVIERDDKLKIFSDLVDEVKMVRAILRKHKHLRSMP